MIWKEEDQNKKILVVSYLFAPQNKIGAIRPSKLVKYLIRKGYDVTVICSDAVGEITDDTLLSEDFNKAKIIRISNGGLYNLFDKVLNKYLSYKKKANRSNADFKISTAVSDNGNVKTSPLKKIKSYIYFLLEVLQSVEWHRQAKKTIKKYSSLECRYDILFSSYGPISSHWVAKYLYIKGKARYWIADFRDPIVVDSKPYFAKKISLRWQSDIVKRSTVFTTVSKGMQEHILSMYQDNTKKSYIVSNGFDEEDFISETTSTFAMNSIENNKFNIGYTGVLYDGRRDIGPLFRALSELINEGLIKKDDVCFQYAGNDGGLLKKQASNYSMESIIHDHGMLTRIESLNLQKKCNLLVVASWNTVSEKGVLTGKIFEYFLAKKPIVSIISGEEKQSELADVVRSCNVGFAYESANEEHDFTLLKEYILMQYKLIINGKSELYQPKTEVLDSYGYSNITDKLIMIFDELKMEPNNEG